MSKVTIDIQQNVNPHFKEVWTTKVPYNVLRGGRNSFKSSVVALQLVMMMVKYIQKGEKANVVVLRKVASTIRDSVFNKMQWALNKFGFAVVKGGDFEPTVAPFRITHKGTGSSFYFYGLDQFEKLKSNDIDNIIAVYYEEAAEFSNEEEFDQTNVTFMRQKHELADHVKFFWTYNPPRNKYHWINSWSDNLIGDDNFLVHDSNYTHDELGFVTEQMLADIERIKRNDYDYYRYIYLGEPVGLGTEVYNMDHFQIIENLPSDDSLVMIDISIDTGYSVSATAMGAYGLTRKGNVILLDTYYYDPSKQPIKKAPSDFAKDIFDFINSLRKEYKVPVDKLTIDSADAATRNQMFKDYGIRLNPVAKKKKINMIESVTDLLVQKRFFVLNNDNNKIFISEHRTYVWDENTLKSDNPNVVKESDHTADSFQYYVQDNMRKLRLKF